MMQVILPLQNGFSNFRRGGTAGFGTVRAGARERANVDLTQELIEVITNQRNFQANAKAQLKLIILSLKQSSIFDRHMSDILRRLIMID